jgi:hypothetical protein
MGIKLLVKKKQKPNFPRKKMQFTEKLHREWGEREYMYIIIVASNYFSTNRKGRLLSAE